MTKKEKQIIKTRAKTEISEMVMIKKQMICRNASICHFPCEEKEKHDFQHTCKIPCQNKFGVQGSLCHQVAREMHD